MYNGVAVRMCVCVLTLFLLFRISEAVELYLDLMSSLQSDITQPVRYDVNKLQITKPNALFLKNRPVK